MKARAAFARLNVAQATRAARLGNEDYRDYVRDTLEEARG